MLSRQSLGPLAVAALRHDSGREVPSAPVHVSPVQIILLGTPHSVPGAGA